MSVKDIIYFDLPLAVAVDLPGFFDKLSPLLLMPSIYIKWFHIISALTHFFQLWLMYF